MEKRKNLTEMSKNNAEYLLNRKRRYRRRDNNNCKPISKIEYKKRRRREYIIRKYLKRGNVILSSKLRWLKESKFLYDNAKFNLKTEFSLHPEYDKKTTRTKYKLIYLVNKYKDSYLSDLKRYNALLIYFGRNEYMDINMILHKNINRETGILDLVCNRCNRTFKTYQKLFVFDKERYSICARCRNEKLCRICGNPHYNSGATCSAQCSTSLARIKKQYNTFSRFVKATAEKLLDEEFYIYQELEEEFESIS